MGNTTSCQAPQAAGGGRAAAPQPQADRSAVCWLRLDARCGWEAALPSRSTCAPGRSTPTLTPATCKEPSPARHAPALGGASPVHSGHSPGRAAAPRAMVSRRANGVSQPLTRGVGSTMGKAWNVVPATGLLAADEATDIMGAHVVVDGGLSWRRGSPLLDRLSGVSPPPESPLPMAGCSGERRPPRTGWWPRPTCTRRRR
jgi:hypothetical protein